MSTDYLEGVGKVISFGQNGKCFLLSEKDWTKRWYSSFRPLEDHVPKSLDAGSYIKFKYTRKGEFNNLVEGSIEIIPMPKDVSKSYEQVGEPMEIKAGTKFIPPLDKDRLIARQACIKAVRLEVKSIEEALKAAEAFENWVFR